MVYKFTVRLKAGQVSPEATRLGIAWNIQGLSISRNYYIQTAGQVSKDGIERMKQVLANPLTEDVTVGEPFRRGSMVHVAYKRGIVDNESESLLKLCRLLAIEAIACKVGTTYEGSPDVIVPRLRESVLNPNIEELHIDDPAFLTLNPQGFRTPMTCYDLQSMTETELADLGRQDGRNLNTLQMKRLRAYQADSGLPAISNVLLESIDARWSDHCLHTTWKALGGLLDVLVQASKVTKNANIVSMFRDNSGVWKFYDGWCLAIKAETHNEPTAISAYFGQLTKFGGVLRDVIGCGHGANPIGTFEYTAIGSIGDNSVSLLASQRRTPKQIAVETIRAIKEYGNTMGVAMMSSRMAFHPKYVAKPFALGGCIGIIPEVHAQKGAPVGGDYVMLIGGLTGNDGIHGASASSAGSTMDRTAVQIGSPLEEVKFREAILELRDLGCIRAITDVGGAGLNSAVGEMGDPNGVWLNTAAVPLKVSDLSTWQILLSESQERMVLAVPRDRLEASREILNKHEVRHTVVGRFTTSGRFTVVHDPGLNEDAVTMLDVDELPLRGEVGMDVPYDVLNDCPLTPLSTEAPKTTLVETKWPQIQVGNLDNLLERILQDSQVFDQSYAGSQYDASVQGLTYYGPYFGQEYRVPTSYWAATPLYGKDCAAVFAGLFDPWLFEVSPALAARQCMLSLLQTQVLAGVSLHDICLCDNFYTPHLERHGHHWLVEMVQEIASLSVLFGTPFISGKDSSAGSTRLPDGQVVSVPPAVFLSALGKVRDCNKLLPNQWEQPGNILVRIGPTFPSIAGTVSSRVLDIAANDLDAPDPIYYKTYLEAIQRLHGSGVLKSGVPIGAGGILARVVLNAFGSRFGAELNRPPGDYHELLHEHRCGAIVEVRPKDLPELPAELRPTPIGRIVDQMLSVRLEGHELLQKHHRLTWATAYQALLEE